MKMQTRKQRARRHAALRAGVWIFLAVFVISVVGMLGGIAAVGGFNR